MQENLHCQLLAASPVAPDLSVVVDGIEDVAPVLARIDDPVCKLMSIKGCGRKRKRNDRFREVVVDNFSKVKRVARARRG